MEVLIKLKCSARTIPGSGNRLAVAEKMADAELVCDLCEYIISNNPL